LAPSSNHQNSAATWKKSTQIEMQIEEEKVRETREEEEKRKLS